MGAYTKVPFLGRHEKKIILLKIREGFTEETTCLKFKAICSFFGYLSYLCTHVNNAEAGDLTRHRSNYDVIVTDYFGEVPDRVGTDHDGEWYHKEKLYACGLLERDPAIACNRYTTLFYSVWPPSSFPYLRCKKNKGKKNERATWKKAIWAYIGGQRGIRSRLSVYIYIYIYIYTHGSKSHVTFLDNRWFHADCKSAIIRPYRESCKEM